MNNMQQGINDFLTVCRRLRWVFPAACAVLPVLYLLSGFYVIKPEETGVIRRFGRVAGATAGSGMHYRLPWPMERLDKVRVQEVRRMSVGFKFLDRYAGIGPSPWEAEFLTGDTNIITIQMIVQYVVRDPVRFLFNVDGVQWLVRKAAEASLVEIIAGMEVDEVLTTGRAGIRDYVKKRVQEILDGCESGVQVCEVNLQELNPPPEVAPAFREVASAREDRQRRINEAQGYENEIIPRAEGEAERTIAAAEADKATRIAEARGDTQRFLSLLTEFEKAPDLTARRYYLERMEEIMARVRKYIAVGDARDPSPLAVRLLERR